MTEIELKELVCKKCGHKWIPRKETVLICPKCKSVRWNRRVEDGWEHN